MRGFLSKSRRGCKSSKKTPPKKNSGVAPLKLIMTRDMQNASSLINSQMNLNKYSWEEDGENVNKS